MPDPERESPVVRTLRAFQARVSSAGPAISASYTLLGSILVLGGVGYALDVRFDTSPACVVGGLILGVVVGLYLLAKTLWRR
jgi:F0F1-type ATP synthase assembly protein I